MDSYISEFVKPYNFISEFKFKVYIIWSYEYNYRTWWYFFLHRDKSEVINDISKMPIYIRLDWLKYNRNELDLKQ
jgi:hypothetical protein